MVVQLFRARVQIKKMKSNKLNSYNIIKFQRNQETGTIVQTNKKTKGI